MVRIGVIGCGKIAQTRHLPEYAGNKDCKIIGVYDLNFERASEIASQYDATAYSSVEELMQLVSVWQIMPMRKSLFRH